MQLGQPPTKNPAELKLEALGEELKELASIIKRQSESEAEKLLEFNRIVVILRNRNE
jgi:hypothetical protein